MFIITLPNGQTVLLTRRDPQEPYKGSSRLISPGCGKIETVDIKPDCIKMRMDVGVKDATGKVTCGDGRSASTWQEFELVSGKAPAAAAPNPADARAFASKESAGAKAACAANEWMSSYLDCDCYGRTTFDARVAAGAKLRTPPLEPGMEEPEIPLSTLAEKTDMTACVTPAGIAVYGARHSERALRIDNRRTPDERRAIATCAGETFATRLRALPGYGKRILSLPTAFVNQALNTCLAKR